MGITSVNYPNMPTGKRRCTPRFMGRPRKYATTRVIRKACLDCGRVRTQAFPPGHPHPKFDIGDRCRSCAAKTHIPSRLRGGITRNHGYLRYSAGPLRGRFVHCVVAEAALGRKLKPGEQVHHINGCKTDNRNGNLLICTTSYHRSLHERQKKNYGGGS